MHEEALVAQINDCISRTGVPGVAVGILHEAAATPLEITVGVGHTHQQHPLPVHPDTLFQIGSITKTMTATVAMRLVEQGKLDLDTPIQAYLPSFRLQDAAATAQVTLRHLFTHTGGWLGDYFEDTGMGDDALARYVGKMAALPQLTPLGALWSYNNAAFNLAGYVIESVTGETFEQVVKEFLFAPLGMDHSFFFSGDIMTHRFAVGHINQAGADGKATVEVATPWPLARSAHPAGGVSATVRDMLRYARFHLHQGRTDAGVQLMQPATLAAMQTKQVAAGSVADGMGISWLLNEIAGVPLVGHGGGTHGQISQFLLVPERQFAFIILTNASRGREVTRDLGNWILAHYLGLQAPAPQLQTLSTAELQSYTGHYTAQLTDVTVTSSAGGLELQIIPKGGFPDKNSPPGPTPPPAPAAFFGQDRVMITDGPSKEAKCEFIRDDQGAVAWFRVGGRVHRRQ
ncbi:MAG: beta-lactamase family protein [Caldilineaceae bacterium]|nr:beta-lactamase family protein [Caldilineaceae bacterium]